MTNIRTGKSWQGADQSVIFQVSCAGRDHLNLPKRFFLIADCQQRSRGFRFELDKPEGVKMQGLAANILRKHVPGSVVRDILENVSTGELWAILATRPDDSGNWMIRIDRSLPPELGLISPDGDIFFRLSSAGSFSKRRRFDGEVPRNATPPFQSRFPSLLMAMADQAEATDEGLEGTVEPNGQLLPPFQKDARDRLARRVKTVRKAIEKMRAQVPRPDDIATAQRNARLLQQFSYLLINESPELTLGPDLTGLDSDVTITIEPGASPGQTINDAFARAKKLQKAMDVGQRRLAIDLAGLRKMEGDLATLREKSLDQGSVESILREHKISLEKQVPAVNGQEVAASKPYKEYAAMSGASILVGKGPRESDELVKAARSNDYWLHVTGTTGSHVIVPYKSLSAGILEKDTLREAAILAIHNSKLRTDMAGEVYITRKQFLKKRKGMDAGLWTVEKSESVFFRYSEPELKQILDRARL